MDRREFLVTVAFLGGMVTPLCNGADLPSPSSPLTLSEHGCGRATGYAVTNKIQDDDSVYVGWRLFGTDPESISFNLCRVADGGVPVKVNAVPIGR